MEEELMEWGFNGGNKKVTGGTKKWIEEVVLEL